MATDRPTHPHGLMRTARTAGAVLLLAAGTTAQAPEGGGKTKPAAAPATKIAPTFAPPIRLKAGDLNLGEKRLYPSPVLQDMNGDGLADLVIGDLRGKITVALRQPGAGLPKFAADNALKGRDGKDLDFANW